MRAVCLLSTCLAAALALSACGRSQLDLSPPPLLAVHDAAAVVVAPDAAPDLAVEAPPDLAPEVRPDVAPEHPPEVRPEAPMEGPPPPPPPGDAGPVCHPQPEVCNGIDDDCNGIVDDGLPPIPCPNGGERYCISGSYSECPRRCEVCVPGSQRECFTAFCTYWGTESCASDGRSFGPCKESRVPAGCEAVTDAAKMDSAELEKCCIAQGLCCNDKRWDLDNDPTTDMLGRCDSVMCGP